ncbi:hypothetical protein [Brevundimonas sp.]|uniref:hypothetical protein n=1 Tax=Brevundimonas sp. TaxID=1871086 RepID=UPI003BAD6120
MPTRAIPICLTLAAVLAIAPVPATTVSAQVAATGARTTNPSVVSAWQRVMLAQSAAQQANEVNGFLRALATEGRRPAELTLDARDIASGRAVAADDPALLQRPQAHEVTLTLDGRFYVFRPLSRASLEPLLRR